MNRTLYFSSEDDKVFVKAKRIASIRGVSMSSEIAKLLRAWVSRQNPEAIRRDLEKQAQEINSVLDAKGEVK